MKKLSLNVDELQVESFSIRTEADARGTIDAHNVPYPTATCPESCANTCATCMNTCQNTCANSCVNTCWETCACATAEFHCTHHSICPPPDVE